MSPESAAHMQTCVDVRSEAISSDQDSSEDILFSHDTNHDMKITKDEFTSAQGSLSNSEDAFDFISFG